jgi:hypothetical protein
MTTKIMQTSRRAAIGDDAAFALQVTDVCMEPTRNRLRAAAMVVPNSISHDKIIELAGRDIGMIGVDRHSISSRHHMEWRGR